jgi:2-polyprenyl-3-methyl-5-hydroxy-6-metoxy-1,4-benzoquinol methylase
LQILRSHIQNGKILEIGAGAGYFLDEAKKIGFDPYAIEFNPIQSKFIRDELKIPCEECPVSTKIFNGTKFDVVYHCDVTSHFYDPIDTFKEINAVTKPGGILFFETGNLGEVSIEKLHTIEKFQYPDHLFFYSVNNISTLLNMCGFEIVGINRYSIVPQLAYIRYSNSIKKTLKRYFGKRAIPRNDNSETTQATPIRSKGLFNKIDEFVSYYIRYSIGKVLNKKDHPQTVLIVARKK